MEKIRLYSPVNVQITETIQEYSTVGINCGNMILNVRAQYPAPSIRAASNISGDTCVIAPRKSIPYQPMLIQIRQNMITPSAVPRLPSQ